MFFGEETKERIQVIPKAVAAKQDVKTLLKDGVKGGVEELVDNALHAVLTRELREKIAKDKFSRLPYVPRIWVQFVDSPHPDESVRDREAALVIQDNGRGMSDEVHRNYLKMGATHSKIPTLDRDPSLPISLDSYINPSLNRYGLGSNSLMGMGCIYQITSREYGSNEIRIVKANFAEWETAQDGSEAYAAVLERKTVLDEDEDDAGEDQGLISSAAGGASSRRIEFVLKHGTQVVIKGLEKQYLDELRDARLRERLRSSLAQDYYLFLCGIPGRVSPSTP